MGEREREYSPLLDTVRKLITIMLERHSFHCLSDSVVKEARSYYFHFVILTRLHKQTWQTGQYYQPLPVVKETFEKRVICMIETWMPGALSGSVSTSLRVGHRRRSDQSLWQQPERLSRM